MQTSMKTSLDMPDEARRALMLAAGAAAATAVIPPSMAWAAQAPDGLPDLSSASPLRISGRVVDETGSALAGRRVVLVDDQGRVAHHDVCDADGRFLLAAAGASGRLRIEVEGARGTRATASAAITGADGTLRCAVQLQPRFA